MNSSSASTDVQNSTNLDSALDQSIQAATALHLTDAELITKLFEHLHHIDNISKQIVQVNSTAQPVKKMFNSLGGP